MYCPKFRLNRTDIYDTIISRLCNTNGSDCPSSCNTCIIIDKVAATKWLRSIGINIDIMFLKKPLPKRLSFYLLTRDWRLMRSTNPFWIGLSIILTGLLVLTNMQYT